jgi:hypothetical protein
VRLEQSPCRPMFFVVFCHLGEKLTITRRPRDSDTSLPDASTILKRSSRRLDSELKRTRACIDHSKTAD